MDNLIYDFGMFDGKDTEFYLNKGFKVVAVEANPELAERNSIKFKKYLESGQLVILNIGIWSEFKIMKFYLNEDNGQFSSFVPEIAYRTKNVKEMDIQCYPVIEIFKKYGEPYYMKVDIEGADKIVLESMRLMEYRPKFLSIEAWSRQAVDCLYELGYNMFCVAPQHDKSWAKLPIPPKEGKYYAKIFGGSDSGPFGRELTLEWKDIAQFKKTYDDEVMSKYKGLSTWFDFHATTSDFLYSNGDSPLQSGSKLVLYYIKTSLQLLEAIVHKATYNADKIGIIILQEYQCELYPNLSKLDTLGFSKIIICNTNEITKKSNRDENVFLNDIKKYYDNLLVENNVEIKDIDDIYVFASFRFSIYALMNNCYFNLFEDASGAASIYGFVQWRAGVDSIDKQKLAETFQLKSGENQNIQTLLYNYECQTKEFSKKKSKNFSLNRCLESLDRSYIDIILKFYHAEKICNNTNSALLLTQYYSLPENLNMFYAQILDYYVGDRNVFIKKHPGDDSDYNFDNISFINKSIPSELIKFITNDRFDLLITYTSSSINMIGDITSKTITLGQNYLKFRELLNKLNTIFSLVLVLPNVKLQYYGIFTDQMEKFVCANNLQLLQWANLKVPRENCLIFLDILLWGHSPAITNSEFIESLRNYHPSTIVVFLNSDNTYPFYSSEHKDLLQYIIPITIKKTAIKDDVLDNMQDETIYFFCKDPSIREKAKEFTMSKTLKYTGIEISVDACNDEMINERLMQLQIACLENDNGVLTSKVAQLEQRLDRLVGSLQTIEK